MKVLIMAAGRGTRISQYIGNAPKCTVDIGGGTPLIRYTVDMWKKHGVDDITIITGYKHNVIENLFDENEVTFLYNPFFDVTNSIASCYFAMEMLKRYDDTIIMNGDVFLAERLFSKLINSKLSPVMFADNKRTIEADYKFKYSGNLLEKYGKELSGEDISGEYVGIAKIDKKDMPVFALRLEEMVNTQQHQVWWENALYSLIGSRCVFIEEVGDNFWAEVDEIQDYERIKEYYAK